MLHIIGLILKIIGIILAVILGILVLLVCVILFVPVRYEIQGQFPGKIPEAKATLKISWLLHLIAVRAWYDEGRLHWKARAAWIRLDSDKPAEEKQIRDGEKKISDEKNGAGKKNDVGKKSNDEKKSDAGKKNDVGKKSDAGNKSDDEKKNNNGEKSDAWKEIDSRKDEKAGRKAAAENVKAESAGARVKVESCEEKVEFCEEKVESGEEGVESGKEKVESSEEKVKSCEEKAEIFDDQAADCGEEKRNTEEKQSTIDADERESIPGKQSAVDSDKEEGKDLEIRQTHEESASGKSGSGSGDTGKKSEKFESEQVRDKGERKSRDDGKAEKKRRKKKRKPLRLILHGLMEKIKKFFAKIKYTFGKICDKLKIVSKKKEQLIAFLEDETHKKAFARVKKELVWLKRFLKPKKCRADLCFGFEDPYHTGQALAVLGMIYPLTGNYMNISPDFERRVLEGEIYLRGTLRAFHLAMLALKVISDGNVRRSYRDIRRMWNK